MYTMYVLYCIIYTQYHDQVSVQIFEEVKNLNEGEYIISISENTTLYRITRTVIYKI